VDTQGRRNIDPADQWVLDPATGTYQLRLDPDEAPAPDEPSQGVPPQGNHRDTAERPSAPRSTAAPATDLTGPRRRKAKPGMPRRKKVLAWTGGTVGFVLVVSAVSGYLIYQHLNNNITTVDVGNAGSKSVTHEGPMNMLVIGTDSRQGLGSKYGDTGSVGHADTTILFHVSADRTNATAVSIPRDIVTSIPDCPTKQKDGSTKVIPGTPQKLTTPKFNESLGQEGRDPGCTMRLVSKMMGGLQIDHFMMVDFEAVKTLSTAVGGVNICLARPLVDPKSHLNLTVGPHTIEGEQALEFVRTRHALRNQSDLDRIKLQQNFLSAMIRQIKSSGTLTSPSKLWTLANAATRALTVDTAIGSVTKLSSLAQDLSKVDTKHITFATLPVVDNPAERVHTTVVVDGTRAPQLISMITSDASLTQARKKPPAPDPKLVGPKATPHATRVSVLNGSGVFGAAQVTVNWLQNTKGVNRSDNGGNAPAPIARTTLRYAPDQADQARSLAAMMGLPATALEQGTVDAQPLAYMTLTLGADFTKPGAPIGTPATVPDGVQKTRADNAACVG
jgi:LCP family protein required for cell wall assembly